jgi:Response regulator containing CheY-like receiver domain and AraC-type DNA-binding domain
MSNNIDYPDYDDYVAELEYYSHRISTPSWQIVQAPLREIDLTYIVGGKAEYFVNGTRCIVKAGDLIYIPKGSMRAAVTFENDLMEGYCLNFRLKNLMGEDVELPFPRISSIGIHPEIISLYNDLNNDYFRREPGYRMKLRGWLQFILHRYMELIVYNSNYVSVDDRIDKVLRYVTKHYSENLSIQSLSQKFGLSQSYFGALFTRVTGLSFRQYLMKVRLNAAEDMLLSGEYSVSDVATACGFTDVFYFSKVFKTSRGVSPSSTIPSVPHISRHIPGSHPGELEVSAT